MSDKTNTRDWWVNALLGKESSPHPIFGSRIKVKADGDTVVLSGIVGTADEREDIEREVRSIDVVKTVVNHLQVSTPRETFHRQTVLALFPDPDTAHLAKQAMSSWTIHEGESELFDQRAAAERYLAGRARNAAIEFNDVKGYLDGVDKGKVLMADTVSEDDALRLIAGLEGSRAECIRTLPPEPESTQGS